MLLCQSHISFDKQADLQGSLGNPSFLPRYLKSTSYFQQLLAFDCAKLVDVGRVFREYCPVDVSFMPASKREDSWLMLAHARKEPFRDLDMAAIFLRAEQTSGRSGSGALSDPFSWCACSRVDRWARYLSISSSHLPLEGKRTLDLVTSACPSTSVAELFSGLPFPSSSSSAATPINPASRPPIPPSNMLTCFFHMR